MLLARLAVDGHWQSQGIGAGLLKDAMLWPLQAADIVGIQALVVHAKDHPEPILRALQLYRLPDGPSPSVFY